MNQFLLAINIHLSNVEELKLKKNTPKFIIIKVTMRLSIIVENPHSLLPSCC